MTNLVNNLGPGAAPATPGPSNAAPRAASSATAPVAPGLPLIGAQIKMAGGLALVPGRAAEIGAEVVQIFNSNARQWRPRPYDPAETEALVTGLKQRSLPLFIHAIYLINMASPDDELRGRSSAALAEAFFFGAVTGAAGLVIHLGSHRGDGPDTAVHRLATGVRLARDLASEKLQTLGATSPLPRLLLESSAGGGSTVGRNLEELATVLESLSGPCGLCLDTAHLFASGTPIHTDEGLQELVADLRGRRLLDSVGLIHLNDSRTPYASYRDHHENLGAGQIGYDALSRVVRHAAFRNVPFVLEVPGLEGHGPDAHNLEVARSMRTGLT